MVGSSFGKAAHKPELITFLAQMSALIEEDRYADAASAIAAFDKEHSTQVYFVTEALPSRVSDHILKKTGAHSAFTTYTLRHPNWATDLTKVSTDPDAFASFIASIEASVRDIAGGMKAA